MFKIGDKVIDSHTNKIGTVSEIYADIDLKSYPISVDFLDTFCTYTYNGRYSKNSDSRYIKKVADITGTVKVSPTHICISFSNSALLLPLALTSFKVVNDILIATYNGKEYTVYTENVNQVISQILNSAKQHL